MFQLSRRSPSRLPWWHRADSGAAAHDRVVPIAMAIGLVLLANCLAITTRTGSLTSAVPEATAVAGVIPVAADRPPATGAPTRPRLLPVQVAAPRVGIRAAGTRPATAKAGTRQVPPAFDA